VNVALNVISRGLYKITGYYMKCVRFVGSKPDENNVYLRAMQIRSSTSFGGEVKPSAPCRKILRHVKDPLRYGRDTDRQKSAAIFHPISLRFATRFPCCNKSRELWWMNRKILIFIWGAKLIIEWSQLHGTLCTIPHRNSNQLFTFIVIIPNVSL
jgi:hypothetical protein